VSIGGGGKAVEPEGERKEEMKGKMTRILDGNQKKESEEKRGGGRDLKKLKISGKSLRFP